mgnify:CR=1 FL=1
MEDKKAIKTVRSTKDGKMVITTDKDQQKEQNIRKIIVDKTEEGNVRQVTDAQRDKRTLYIRNLDATMSKGEVNQAIRSKLEDGGEI